MSVPKDKTLIKRAKQVAKATNPAVANIKKQELVQDLMAKNASFGGTKSSQKAHAFEEADALVASYVQPGSTVNVKQKQKTTPTNWADVVHKAISVAGKLVPAVLPFFATHSTVQKALAAGIPLPGQLRSSATTPRTAGFVAPAAQSGSMSNMVGIKDWRVVGRNDRGTVTTIRVVIMGFLGDIPTTAFNAGDSILEYFISPIAPGWEETRLYDLARMFQNFKYHDLCILYDPTCASDSAGAIVMGISPDPDEVFETAESRVVVASWSHSDCFAVWTPGGCALDGSGIRKCYTQVDGTDMRWVANGKLHVVAQTDLAGGVALGSLYYCADVEFSVPSASENSAVGTAMKITGVTFNNTNTYNFVSTRQELQNMGGFFSSGISWTQSGTARSGDVISNLPVGEYFLFAEATGTTLGGLGVVRPDQAVDLLSLTQLNAIQNSAATVAMSAYYVEVTAFRKGTPLLALSMSNATVTAFVLWLFRVPPLLQPAMAKHAMDYRERNRRFIARTAEGMARANATAALDNRMAIEKLVAMLSSPKQEIPSEDSSSGLTQLSNTELGRLNTLMARLGSTSATIKPSL